MKAVIYARYSSDNQREESIEGQLRECTAYCKKNNITILRTYIDRALSAKTDNRPDFQRMIKDSAKGLFDMVIVWKLDRFARNRYDSAHYKAQLRKYGVKVLSATENISDGPEGIILESMLEGMAEYYSAELSEKVIRGHTENALKCKYNGGTPTFGYLIDNDKQYQIDPRRAPVVLDIFTQYDKGATMKEIRDFLNAVGVTTVRGKPVDLNFVSYILHNRKFIGEYSYRDIVVPNGIPAIVPQDLFDRVQERMAKNKKAPARHKAEDDYLLTTKLFCGTCKAMMVGECGTSASQNRKYHYYRCVNTKKHKTCNSKHKSIRKLPIENAVVNEVMKKIMDDAFVEYIADTVMEMQTRESSTLPALRKQLEETERGITNMLNAIQAGIFNASTKQRLDELEQKKAEIELEIIHEEMRHPMLTREDVTYWICRFRMLDIKQLEERRRLIDSFVNSVTVFDEYIVITFNYKEGTATVPFSKLDSSDLSSVGGPKVQNPLMRSLDFSVCMERDSNNKCNADERCRRRLDGGEPLSAPSGADANESRHSDQKASERESTSGMTESESQSLFDPWGGTIRALCEAGRICHKVPEKKAYQLCPAFEPMEEEPARLELARRYFTYFGPVTVKDAAYFFGTTQTKVKTWLKRLPVAETPLDGKSYFYIDNDLPADELPACLFLAGFDQLMLGYEKTERLFLPREHMRDIFNLAGIVRPAILVNGTVVGWWNLKNRKLKVTLFSPADQKLISNAATGLWSDLKQIEYL